MSISPIEVLITTITFLFYLALISLFLLSTVNKANINEKLNRDLLEKEDIEQMINELFNINYLNSHNISDLKGIVSRDFYLKYIYSSDSSISSYQTSDNSNYIFALVRRVVIDPDEISINALEVTNLVLAEDNDLLKVTFQKVNFNEDTSDEGFFDDSYLLSDFSYKSTLNYTSSSRILVESTNSNNVYSNDNNLSMKDSDSDSNRFLDSSSTDKDTIINTIINTSYSYQFNKKFFFSLIDKFSINFFNEKRLNKKGVAKVSLENNIKYNVNDELSVLLYKNQKESNSYIDVDVDEDYKTYYICTDVLFEINSVKFTYNSNLTSYTFYHLIVTLTGILSFTILYHLILLYIKDNYFKTQTNINESDACEKKFNEFAYFNKNYNEDNEIEDEYFGDLVAFSSNNSNNIFRSNNNYNINNNNDDVNDEDRIIESDGNYFSSNNNIYLSNGRKNIDDFNNHHVNNNYNNDYKQIELISPNNLNNLRENTNSLQHQSNLSRLKSNLRKLNPNDKTNSNSNSNNRPLNNESTLILFKLFKNFKKMFSETHFYSTTYYKNQPKKTNCNTILDDKTMSTSMYHPNFQFLIQKVNELLTEINNNNNNNNIKKVSVVNNNNIKHDNKGQADDNYNGYGKYSGFDSEGYINCYNNTNVNINSNMNSYIQNNPHFSKLNSNYSNDNKVFNTINSRVLNFDYISKNANNNNIANSYLSPQRSKSPTIRSFKSNSINSNNNENINNYSNDNSNNNNNEIDMKDIKLSSRYNFNHLNNNSTCEYNNTNSNNRLPLTNLMSFADKGNNNNNINNNTNNNSNNNSNNNNTRNNNSENEMSFSQKKESSQMNYFNNNSNCSNNNSNKPVNLKLTNKRSYNSGNNNQNNANTSKNSNFSPYRININNIIQEEKKDSFRIKDNTNNPNNNNLNTLEDLENSVYTNANQISNYNIKPQYSNLNINNISNSDVNMSNYYNRNNKSFKSARSLSKRVSNSNNINLNNYNSSNNNNSNDNYLRINRNIVFDKLVEHNRNSSISNNNNILGVGYNNQDFHSVNETMNNSVMNNTSNLNKINNSNKNTIEHTDNVENNDINNTNNTNNIDPLKHLSKSQSIISSGAFSFKENKENNVSNPKNDNDFSNNASKLKLKAQFSNKINNNSNNIKNNSKVQVNFDNYRKVKSIDSIIDCNSDFFLDTNNNDNINTSNLFNNSINNNNNNCNNSNNNYPINNYKNDLQIEHIREVSEEREFSCIISNNNNYNNSLSNNLTFKSKSVEKLNSYNSVNSSKKKYIDNAKDIKTSDIDTNVIANSESQTNIINNAANLGEDKLKFGTASLNNSNNNENDNNFNNTYYDSSIRTPKLLSKNNSIINVIGANHKKNTVLSSNNLNSVINVDSSHNLINNINTTNHTSNKNTNTNAINNTTNTYTSSITKNNDNETKRLNINNINSLNNSNLLIPINNLNDNNSIKDNYHNVITTSNQYQITNTNTNTNTKSNKEQNMNNNDNSDNNNNNSSNNNNITSNNYKANTSNNTKYHNNNNTNSQNHNTNNNYNTNSKTKIDKTILNQIFKSKYNSNNESSHFLSCNATSCSRKNSKQERYSQAFLLEKVQQELSLLKNIIFSEDQRNVFKFLSGNIVITNLNSIERVVLSIKSVINSSSNVYNSNNANSNSSFSQRIDNELGYLVRNLFDSFLSQYYS